MIKDKNIYYSVICKYNFFMNIFLRILETLARNYPKKMKIFIILKIINETIRPNLKNGY